ncbi:uncharacterized protein EI90DRAFT_3043316 [Cantharellus anzutake]|uniref:uncharacterized protein n=1 Tax=Cantharellus anzutake TaxID=1750568 RepID=UPI001904608F|nr:uncharacterized protein EI90DRAFT_3043316 [Cantharellus anzutake]KAF8337538.1 hypothetical protein EI90DRAFT_3043316 [Cantharellus anzutake]
MCRTRYGTSGGTICILFPKPMSSFTSQVSIGSRRPRVHLDHWFPSRSKISKSKRMVLLFTSR